MAILDQMNVKANEQDTQGTDYDIRDRKLTTATSQQVVNTGDVVLLKDTSGNYHEIDKASFMSAVRGALGSLIKSYDKGTAINGVAVTGSTGTVNDLGFSSPSDLASVLGDAAKFAGHGRYLHTTLEVNDEDNPTNSYFTRVIIRELNNSYPLVIGIPTFGNISYLYIRNNESGWKKIPVTAVE